MFWGGWTLIKIAFAVLGLACLVGGFVYGHNDQFKVQCAIHKEGGPSLPFPKNAICALDFQIDHSR